MIIIKISINEYWKFSIYIYILQILQILYIIYALTILFDNYNILKKYLVILRMEPKKSNISGFRTKNVGGGTQVIVNTKKNNKKETK